MAVLGAMAIASRARTIRSPILASSMNSGDEGRPPNPSRRSFSFFFTEFGGEQLAHSGGQRADRRGSVGGDGPGARNERQFGQVVGDPVSNAPERREHAGGP